jgi:hypothetical protein
MCLHVWWSLTAVFASFFTNGYNVEEAMAKEIRQGIAAVDACERAGVKHLVYSALEDYPESKTVPFTATKARSRSSNSAAKLTGSLGTYSTNFFARHAAVHFDVLRCPYQERVDFV